MTEIPKEAGGGGGPFEITSPGAPVTLNPALKGGYHCSANINKVCTWKGGYHCSGNINQHGREGEGIIVVVILW